MLHSFCSLDHRLVCLQTESRQLKFIDYDGNMQLTINVFSILTFLSLDNAIPFHFDQVGRRDATTREEVQYRALGK